MVVSHCCVKRPYQLHRRYVTTTASHYTDQATLNLYHHHHHHPCYHLYAGIYNYIPETGHVSRVYSVATVLYLQSVLHVLLLLSSSSSSSSLCRVFILTFLRQTMSLGNTVLQLFCCYYSWCLYR